MEKDYLKEQLKKVGYVVYTILRHVSPSGMSRVIACVIILDDKPCDISYQVADILDWKLDDKHCGVKVSGCGMDMGFHLVYQLSAELYGYKEQGAYKLKQYWL